MSHRPKISSRWSCHQFRGGIPAHCRRSIIILKTTNDEDFFFFLITISSSVKDGGDCYKLCHRLEQDDRPCLGGVVFRYRPRTTLWTNWLLLLEARPSACDCYEVHRSVLEGWSRWNIRLLFRSRSFFGLWQQLPEIIPLQQPYCKIIPRLERKMRVGWTDLHLPLSPR